MDSFLLLISLRRKRVFTIRNFKRYEDSFYGSEYVNVISGSRTPAMSQARTAGGGERCHLGGVCARGALWTDLVICGEAGEVTCSDLAKQVQGTCGMEAGERSLLATGVGYGARSGDSCWSWCGRWYLRVRVACSHRMGPGPLPASRVAERGEVALGP